MGTHYEMSNEGSELSIRQKIATEPQWLLLSRDFFPVILGCHFPF